MEGIPAHKALPVVPAPEKGEQKWVFAKIREIWKVLFASVMNCRETLWEEILVRNALCEEDVFRHLEASSGVASRKVDSSDCQLLRHLTKGVEQVEWIFHWHRTKPTVKRRTSSFQKL